MNPQFSVEVVRGKKGFGAACSVAAASLAMMACAQAAVAATPAGIQPFDRAMTAETTAAQKLKGLLSNQEAQAQPVSKEQQQTLSFGRYPPIKTTVLIDGKKQTHWTMHPFDLVSLSRAAATSASKIEGIKVNPDRVGAIMLSESSMVARTGWSANGKTASYGLGQLESRTANALGVNDPNDPRQSANAIARLIAQAMRFAKAHPNVDERIAVSLAYNTSTSLRESLVRQHGAALSVDKLPIPTQHHVKNMAYSENLMARFSRLNDQHEKITLSAARTPSSLTPKDHAMNTAHRPAPSTRSLVASLSTDHANRERLVNNQKYLEQTGHVQSVPMTSKGLEVMRAAVSAHVARAAMASPAAVLAAKYLLPRATEQVAKLALALQEKVAAALTTLRPVMQAQNKQGEESGPGKNATSTALAKAGEVGTAVFGMAKQAMRQQREIRQQQLRDARDQPRPA